MLDFDLNYKSKFIVYIMEITEKEYAYHDLIGESKVIRHIRYLSVYRTAIMRIIN